MKVRKKIPKYMEYISYLLFTILYVNNFYLIDVTYYLDYKILILVLVVLILPIVIYHDNKTYNIEDAFYLIGSILLLSIAYNIIINLREENLLIIFYIMLITIMTDTFAYFGGCKYGKHKLIPSISPNKSVEGLVIGTFFGTAIASVFYILFIGNANPYLIVIFTMLLSLIGQFGDLIFSSIKRLYEVKDFSNIMPGHGGILDRLDSIIFVLLAYVYIIELL
jgi:phosphatidate cytidylyltransferase